MRLGIKRMSLRRLQMVIEERGPEFYPEVIAALDSDPRGGAQRLVRFCQLRLQAWIQEQQKLLRMCQYEKQVWAMGYSLVAGVDAVGRGPLAGPVVAGAVILPKGVMLTGLDDSKHLSQRRRDEVYEKIRKTAVAIGVGVVDPDGIDESSVLLATYSAMTSAVKGLAVQPDYLLVDSLNLPGVVQPQYHVANGETSCCSVAAASIVAKVIRDQQMLELDRLYPQYGFAHHKGYGTAEHRSALLRYGPCPAHRRLPAMREVSGRAGDVLEEG